MIADGRVTRATEGEGSIKADPVSAVHCFYVPASAIPVSIFQVALGGIMIANSRVT